MTSLQWRFGTLLKNTIRLPSTYSIHSSTPAFIKVPLDDAEVNYIDHLNTCHTMSFAKLKELATTARSTKQRELLKVQAIGQDQVRPTFRLANQRELEVLVHKSRVEKKYAYFLVDLEHPDLLVTKLKEKIFNISLSAGASVVDNAVVKARKALEKGNFVVIKLEKRGHNSSEVKDFEVEIKQRCLEAMSDKESKLIFVTKGS